MPRFPKKITRWLRRPKSSTKKGKRWSLSFFLLGGMTVVFWSQYQAFFEKHATLSPTHGGIFTESSVGTIENLSPFALVSSSLDQDIQALLFEGLLRYNPETGQISDGIGTLRISEDKKTYYITLKPDIYFHDGEPVTMDDVLFTYEQILKNENFPNRFLRDTFEYVSIDRVDEYSLSFSLPEQNVFFPFSLVQPILPRHHFQNILIEEVVDPDYPFNKKPIGTGPYKLNNIVQNDDGSARVFLNRHDKYHRGKPYIDQVVLYIFPTTEQLEAQHEWTTSYAHIPERELKAFTQKAFETSGSTSVSPMSKYKQQGYLLPRFVATFINLDRPHAKQLRVRQALSLALDKDKILRREDGWKRTDSAFFFDSIENWHTQNIVRARQLLRDEGYNYDDNQEVRISDETNEPLKLTFITSTNPPVYSRLAQNMEKMWEDELDIDIDLQILQPAEFQEAVSAREYDMVLFGMSHSENYEGLSTWHSSQTGGFNLSNMTNQNVDFLISEVRFSGAVADLVELNNKIDQLVPAIILGTPQYSLLIDKTLKGFDETLGKIRSHAQRFSNIHLWYFNEKPDWNWPQNRSKTWGFIKWIFGDRNPLNRADVKAKQMP